MSWYVLCSVEMLVEVERTALPEASHCAVAVSLVRGAMAAETRRTLSEATTQTEALLTSCQLMEVRKGVSYDMDGKFSYSQVRWCEV